MTMSFRLVYRVSAPAGISPYRIVDQQNHEIPWINDFLDAQHIHGFSPRSVRSYGYDLLNFVRWWCQRKPASLSCLNESRLRDYVRHQLESLPKPTPQTINHRLTVVRGLYRFHCGRELPFGRGSVDSIHKTHSRFGYGKPWRVVGGGVRLRQHRRVVVPLSSEEVSQFWSSFLTYRDLSLTALMLFNGLRSREVEVNQLDLQREYHRARQKMRFPTIPNIGKTQGNPGIPTLVRSVAEAHHLMEMFRRQLKDSQLQRKMERLINRLEKISSEMSKFEYDQK